MAYIKGWQEQFGISSTSSTVDKRLNFFNDQFTKTRNIILPQGGDGNIDPLNNRARLGSTQITGSVSFEPTAVELSYLLPWILGGTPSGTSYPLGQTPPAYWVSIDKSLKVLDYTGVRVARATFNSAPNQPLTLTLDLMGLTETVSNSGTFPSLTADSSTDYFILTDAVVTVNSVAVCTEFVQIVIDNGLQPAPFTNCSAGPVEMINTERIITLSVLPGYTSDSYTLFPPSESGWASNVTWTNGTVSLNMDFVKVKFDHKSPFATTMKEIVKLPLTGRAFRTSSTAALVTTLDSTP